MADARALGADLLVRLGVDASGVAAEVSAKLTAAERAAVSSGDRIASGVARGADRATAAQLRVVSATERYNTVLKRQGATQGQIASAQASLITARRSAATAMDRERVSAERLNRQTGLLSGTVKSFIGGLGVGYTAFRFLRVGLDEVKDFQAGLAQTQAGIKSTGGVANVAARDVQNLAGSVQSYSGFTDDAVVSASNLLLTFTNVRNEAGRGNDVFNRAIKATADLQARGFGPMETGAKQLGKALQDPIKGTGALSRAGVQFTAAQKASIKSLVDTGRILDAQKIILKEVETQVGGSARAFGQTLPGQLERGKRSLENFAQTGLTPVLDKSLDVFEFFSDHKTARSVALYSGAIVGGLALANKAVKFYGEVSSNVLRRNTEKVASNLAVAGSYDKVAAAAGRAAAIEGRGTVLGKGGRGRAVAGTAGLIGLGIGGVAAQQSGNGFVSGAGTVAASTAAGAAIGSIFPGAGTAIGAGVGATLGLGALVFGRDDKDGTKTTRSVAAVSRELSRIDAQIRASKPDVNTLGTVDQGRVLDLVDKRKKLSQELRDAKSQARETAPVFNSLTGEVENMTRAQIKAAAATTKHKDAQKAAAAEFERVRQSFSRDPFAEDPGLRNVSTARDALKDAIKARDQASQAITEARQGKGGSAASSTDIRVAELRLQAARQRLAKGTSTPSEQAAVLSAQQRVNDLRAKGKATAEQTAGAEGKIRDAIDSQRAAQERVNEARKALDEAKGVSAPEALKRLRANIAAQGQLAGDLKTLVGKGASQETLAEFRDLEKQAPGTINRIANTASKRYVREFGAGIADLNRKTSIIAKIFTGSEKQAELQARRDAAAYDRGWKAYFAAQREAGTGIFTPVGGPIAPADTPSRAAPAPVRTLPNKVLSAGFPAS